MYIRNRAIGDFHQKNRISQIIIFPSLSAEPNDDHLPAQYVHWIVVQLLYYIILYIYIYIYVCVHAINFI